jgi:hypothetical protein
MSIEEDRKDRVDKIVKELMEKGWSRVVMGETVIYQKPAPIREQDESEKGKPKRRK